MYPHVARSKTPGNIRRPRPRPWYNLGMHNPLRSEADAFRLAVIIGLGAAAGIVVARPLGPAARAAPGAALVGLGVGMACRSARGTLPRTVSVGRRPDGKHRLLVVANETIGGRALLEEIRNRCHGQDCEILLVTPSLTRSRAAHWTSDLD